MLHYPDEIIEVITASHRVMQVRRPFELEEQLHRIDDPNGICGVIIAPQVHNRVAKGKVSAANAALGKDAQTRTSTL